MELMKGSKSMARIASGRKPPILSHELVFVARRIGLPKADTTNRGHRVQFNFELVTQSKLLISDFQAYVVTTHTDNAKTPRDNSINMSDRPPTHSPPSPPYPNIFFKRWPFTSCPDIYFSLNSFYFLPTFFLFFLLIRSEVIKRDVEDEEEVEMEECG